MIHNNKRAHSLSASAPRLLGAIGLSALLGGLLQLPAPAAADTGVTRIPIVDAPAGTTGLGAGFRYGTSEYRNLDNISSILNENTHDLVPLYLYEGKYLFAHGTSGGIHLLQHDVFTLDAVARYRFDRLESDADDYFRTIEDREQTVDTGISAAVSGRFGSLSATWVTDALDTHNGEEWDITWRFHWQSGPWTLSPFVSYVYQDSDLTSYYYGVSAAESRSDLPTYEPGSAEFGRAGLNSSYQLSRRLLLFANIVFEGVDSNIAASPLVEEDQTSAAFVGLSYFFGSALEQNYVRRNKAAVSGDWSWRVNAGYTAEETFHKVHRGYMKRSEDVHTYLVGATVGKLLQDGKKIDYWGRFSLNRRLENDLQDDFFEYVAYVMAMGTGYSPWSKREAFRYGFGFGFSYADRVPIVEQIKQERRGRNTSHFLNYLEAQVDTPLSNIFGDRASKHCYVGITLVHRSGIFATSDILGNVGGGSDVVTTHLECKR